MQKKTIFTPFIALLVMLFSSHASAVLIDFIDLTQKAGGLGESSWESLSAADHADLNHFGFNVTGHASTDDDNDQFAYLDWGNAGLGVCKDVIGGTASGANPGSSANSCDPSSDDNVTVGEWLEFSFTEAVHVNLWFNNNHDGGFGAGDMVTIESLTLGTLDLSVSEGYAGGPNGLGIFEVAAGEILKVAYNNEEFYVSGMSVNPVPVPAAIWLFGSALIGFIGLGRRTNVA